LQGNDRSPLLHKNLNYRLQYNVPWQNYFID
jgi:hypothetical protein